MKEMKVSIIIAFYKNLAALELIIKALTFQSFRNFEVIIAEDDNSTATKLFIDNLIKQSEISIQHVYQTEDAGFRKNQILNRAIQISNGEFIIFIDGDCIPHKHFIKRYTEAADSKTALFGRRVMLSEKLTTLLYETKDLKLLSLWYLITNKAKGLKYAFGLPVMKQPREIGIYGCNWGLYKQELLAINGYDEDYTTAGVG
ncbi:MAG: glycosyltransferase, partial [bacterium]|nr:glycosyltransferase [bacterium]